MARLRLSALALAVGAMSCSSSQFGVDLTLSFDEGITNAQLASIKSLVETAQGDESYEHTTARTRTLNRTEYVRYIPSAKTLSLDISILAEDQTGGAQIAAHYAAAK